MIRSLKVTPMETLLKFIIPGIIFLLTVASGLWLSKFGKPLNSGIFTIHKLIALGGVIITAVQIFNDLKTIQIQFFLVALIVFTGVCVLALFATGALMSVGKVAYNLMLTIHKVAPFLLVISLALTVYLLMGRKP